MILILNLLLTLLSITTFIKIHYLLLHEVEYFEVETGFKDVTQCSKKCEGLKETVALVNDMNGVIQSIFNLVIHATEKHSFPQFMFHYILTRTL